MSLTFNDTTNNQGLVQDLRFISGQDSLSVADATRLLNHALDSYTHLAFKSSGRWKFDDSTYTDRSIATATLSASEPVLALDVTYLVIDEVEVYHNGKWTVVDAGDASRDNDGTPFAITYADEGKPVIYDSSGTELTFYPSPDEDVTVRLWFMRPANHFAVTDTTSTIGIPSIHHEYLTLYAAERLMMRTNDKNLAAVKMARKEKADEVVEFYGYREMNTPQVLTANVNIPE